MVRVVFPFLAGIGWAAEPAAVSPAVRSIALNPPPPGTPGFTLLSAEATGLAFTNRLARSRFLTNQIHLNGSGVALGDVDDDGWCDIVLAGLDGPNALYRNLGGWRFTNVAEAAGVALAHLDTSGVMLADLDGDGDLDLALNTVAMGTHLLLNDGRARFRPAPGSPFNLGKGGMSMAAADVEGDGDLDLYVGNYRSDTFRDQPGTRFRGRNVGGRMVLQTVNGRSVTEPDLVGRYTISASGAVEEHGEADLFLRNEGGGRFTPLGMTDGLFLDEAGRPLSEPPYDWTLSVLFRDVNGDRAPDLYVCNDFGSPDLLWLNDGAGRFRPAPALALRHTPMFSMGIDAADLDHDGRDDLLVVDMLGPTHAKRHTQLGDVRPQWFPPGLIENRPQYSHNQLFLDRGDGGFAEVGWMAGVTATDWTWSPLFLDVDLDGEEDLLMATGHELEMMDADIGEKAEGLRRARMASAAEVQQLKLLYPRHAIPNVALRHRGDVTFEEATTRWRFGVVGVTTGMAAADLDNDGDVDVVLNNLNDAASLLRNDAPGPRVAVRLRGHGANTRGVGARIRVSDGTRVRSQVIMAGGRYLSSDAPVRTFATGAAPEVSLEVIWRSGVTSRVDRARSGMLHEIAEPEGLPTGITEAPREPPWFADESAALAHGHVDEPFDDFAVQPLLPRRLGQEGPGVAWADWDGDGWEDLAIGGGRGGTVAFFRNVEGRLRPWEGFSPAVKDGDILGLIAWPEGTNGFSLWGARASWEDGSTDGPAVRSWNPVTGRTVEALGAMTMAGSTAALAAADFDADGDLDVFVGGRAVPARYPEAATSRLLRNEAGRWVPLPEGDRWLEGLGLVTGALWTDLRGDGFPDLVIACEWGGIRVLDNDRGVLREAVIPLRQAAGVGGDLGLPGPLPDRLSALTGCWSGLASADLDGDGRTDLVIGNWGLNSRWQLRGRHPLRLYYGDYDGNGALEILEAVHVEELGDDAPLRNLRAVSASLPFTREAAPTHAEFGRTTIPRLLGSRLDQTRRVEAVTLAVVALLNRGDAFEVRALPFAAQVSPVFAVTVADFDGDGRDDVFLGQNCFGVHGDAARQDAGRGLVLRGDGAGGLHPLDSATSGVRIDGEQRGAATADYDADGRPDLVVTQHAASTKLWHNVGGRPGLRVRVHGPNGNPAGVGVRLRWRKGGDRGPVREIHAGTGWLSQDGSVVILGGGREADELEVQWPGGERRRVLIPRGSAEVTVRW